MHSRKQSFFCFSEESKVVMNSSMTIIEGKWTINYAEKFSKELKNKKVNGELQTNVGLCNNSDNSNNSSNSKCDNSNNNSNSNEE